MFAFITVLTLFPTVLFQHLSIVTANKQGWLTTH